MIVDATLPLAASILDANGIFSEQASVLRSAINSSNSLATTDSTVAVAIAAETPDGNVTYVEKAVWYVMNVIGLVQFQLAVVDKSRVEVGKIESVGVDESNPAVAFRIAVAGIVICAVSVPISLAKVVTWESTVTALGIGALESASKGTIFGSAVELKMVCANPTLLLARS